MKVPSNGFAPGAGEGEKKSIDLELWHACAGPLVSLPPAGSLVVYFPQGHSEQVAASIQKETTSVPGYPNLPSKLICMLHNVTLHADPETDEVYAQMTLQPVSKYDQVSLLASNMGLKQRQPAEFFCKTLTASDTSTHGGFSVPRRAAEKIFSPLDFSMQPPSQEIVATDIHHNTWTFRHVYRGQPKRHLLTTGWSVFVSTKRLFAGDSVLFIRDKKSQLLVGLGRANRQQPALSSSVISSDSMHIGILAAAAHAAANNSPFTIFYNPRTSPAEFVIPLAKYNKALYTQVSIGMRFRMMFETEELGIRRYMGTITGISDLDPVRWKNSQWRNLQVGWDESTAGEHPSRVSIWEIEPVVTPFYICPPPFFRPKFPGQPGMPESESDIENAFKRTMPWLGDEFGMKDAQSSIFPGMSLVQWMSMQQGNQLHSAQPGVVPPLVSSLGLRGTNLGLDDPSKLLSFQSAAPTQQSNNTDHQLNKTNPPNTMTQLPQPNVAWSQLQQQQPNQQVREQNQELQIQLQQQPPQLLQQQILQPFVHNGVAASNPVLSQTALQHPVLYSQLQQQHQPLLGSNAQSHQTIHGNGKSSVHASCSFPRDQKFLAQVERRPSLLPTHEQRQQLQPLSHIQQSLSQQAQQQQQLPTQVPHLSQHNNLPEQQLQLQLLQKLQQQQQLLSSVSPPPQPQLLQSLPQSQPLQQPHLHQQPQQLSCNSLSASPLLQSQQKPLTAVQSLSGLVDNGAASCSTPPSTNNFHNSKTQQTSQALLMREPVVEPVNNSHLIQDNHHQLKPEARIKAEMPISRAQDNLKYKTALSDQLDVSSSATSYCLDASTIQRNVLPTFGLDGYVQSNRRNSSFTDNNIDNLAPDMLLSRGFDSQKDLQNMMVNYGGNPGDIETELSTAAMSSQSFGVPNMPFDVGCSNDVGINDAGVPNGGMWTNQAQRMRTYTKVQKRGSVGRSIDVTRYGGYEELRQDLGRMFGIGQLEDPQRTEWKLVYMDHENDMLLVGDDPWEEFVSNVQSIKILSSAEVQQMSLEGSLGNIPVPNQGCGGTDSRNPWRNQYNNNSATSFN